MFILYILFSIVLGTRHSCERYINNLLMIKETEGYKPLLKKILPYATLSGNSLNQFGMFEACLRKGFFYSSVKIEMDPLPSYYGLCHTTECTTEDLNDDVLQDDVKSLINETGILQKYNISLNDADFIFYNPQQYGKNYGIMFQFTIFIMIMFIILSCFNPIFCQLIKLKNQNKITNINYLQDIEKNSEDENQILTLNDKSKRIEVNDDVKSIFFEYSISENYKTLFDFKENENNISIMEGFRSIGFLMVIFGHQFLDLAKSSFIFEMIVQLKSWLCLNLVNMFYSVDMFFWLGGFFFGYILFESKKLKLIQKNGFSIILLLLHRILRIWPCYVIAILISSQLIPLIGDGPRWFMAVDRLECQTGWRNLLFIDNLFYDTKYCFPWGWYLSTDMQLFTISLIPLIFYAKISTKFAKFILYLLLISSQSIGIYITFHYEYLLPPFAFMQPNMYQNYYTKPFTRGPPYFLGVIIGLLYREYKENSNQNQIFYKINNFIQKSNKNKEFFIIFSYLFGFGIIGLLWFGWRSAQLHWEHTDYWNKTLQEVWFAFSRLGFTLGMTFLALPNLMGIKDIFNYTFMRNIYFRFINKISFSGYLIHQIIIFGILGQFYQTPNFSFQTIFTLYIGNLTITIISSIGFCLLIELPLNKMENRLIKLITNK